MLIRALGPIAATAAAAIFSTAALPQATPGDVEENLEVVPYPDLDLAQPLDGARLYDRIVGAAKQACGRPRAGNLTELQDADACFRAAVQGAVNRLDSPTVTDAHLDRFSWARMPGSEAADRLAQRP